MFDFYVISTICSILIMEVTSRALKNRLKRDGIYKKKTKSFAERLKPYIVLLLPIYNIILAVSSLFIEDKVYESYKADYIKETQGV